MPFKPSNCCDSQKNAPTYFQMPLMQLIKPLVENHYWENISNPYLCNILLYSILYIFTDILLMFSLLVPFHLYWTMRNWGIKDWLFPLSIIGECSTRSRRKLFSLAVIWDEWLNPAFQYSENLIWHSSYSQPKFNSLKEGLQSQSIQKPVFLNLFSH